MHLVQDRVSCVAVGLGAAFDFYAGAKKVSPHWIRRSGLDWLWRLLSEPRRLWRRYVFGNAIFLFRFFPLFLGRRLRGRDLSWSGAAR